MIPAPQMKVGDEYSFTGKVLLIEDADIIREIVKSELVRIGYQVTEASNGREGLKQAFEEIPDVIISDFSMPELNGLEVLERVRCTQRGERVPFILMSSYPGKMFTKECMRLKADAFLEKPFEFRQLTETLQKVLSKSNPETGDGSNLNASLNLSTRIDRPAVHWI